MVEEPNKDSEGAEKENQFCPLCAKYRKASDFKPMNFAYMGRLVCKKDVCTLCHVVLGNARKILDGEMARLVK